MSNGRRPKTARHPCHQEHPDAVSFTKSCHVCDGHILQRLLQEIIVVQTLYPCCLGSAAGSGIDQLMTVGQLFNSSVSQFPHIQKWHNHSTYHIGLLYGLHELIYTDHLKQNHRIISTVEILISLLHYIFFKGFCPNVVKKSSKLWATSVTNEI